MTKEEFAAEANRRLEEFLFKAGYSADGTVTSTRNFVQTVLDIKPEPVVSEAQADV
jgi:hypothetical protein